MHTENVSAPLWTIRGMRERAAPGADPVAGRNHPITHATLRPTCKFGEKLKL